MKSENEHSVVQKLIHAGLPKGHKEGKFGSPQRGDSKKGYRYDKEGHPNAKDPNEKGPHVNYWDYTKGKKGKGGKHGAIPVDGKIVVPGAALGTTLFGEDSAAADVVDLLNPLSDVQDVLDLITDLLPNETKCP